MKIQLSCLRCEQTALHTFRIPGIVCRILIFDVNSSLSLDQSELYNVQVLPYFLLSKQKEPRQTCSRSTSALSSRFVCCFLYFIAKQTENLVFLSNIFDRHSFSSPFFVSSYSASKTNVTRPTYSGNQIVIAALYSFGFSPEVITPVARMAFFVLTP